MRRVHSYDGHVRSHYKFTGKERDSESGLDNFGARYNASTMGRFMTPDWSSKPAAVPFADPANPQSLNLYSYVTNNFLSRIDPLGHNWFDINGTWQWQKGHVCITMRMAMPPKTRDTLVSSSRRQPVPTSREQQRTN